MTVKQISLRKILEKQYCLKKIVIFVSVTYGYVMIISGLMKKLIAPEAD